MADHKSLAAALAAAQAEFPLIVKGSHNPHFKSTYASLSDGIEPVRPILAKHGIAYTQVFTKGDDGSLVLRTKLKHGSEEEVSDLPCDMMPNVQQFMSKQTYLRRCGLFAILGLCPADEDDDGNAAAQAPEASRHVAPSPRQQQSSRPSPPAHRPAASAPRAVEAPANDGQADPAKIRHLEPREAAGTLKVYLRSAPVTKADEAWVAYRPWVLSWEGIDGRGGETLTGEQLAALFDQLVAERISSVVAAE